jgi:archaemetzincin
VKRIYVVAVGDVAESILQSVDVCVWQSFGMDVVRMQPLSDPGFAYDDKRGQYGSTPILQELLARCPSDATRLLGLTGRDLFIPMLSFVYGQAQLNGRVALVSVARLRQEFYGLPAEPEWTIDRVLCETLHELGHTFGLIHCLDPACCMALATNIQKLDAKESEYCSGCSAVLAQSLKPERAEVRR